MIHHSEESSAGSKPRYRADIDGLRAIAVSSVVLFHAGVVPFASGFIGVDVFFVISGYLIGAIVLREAAAGDFSFARFYARRARRILPALIVVVLATCLAGALLLTANEFKDVGALGTLALVGASNINFWQFQDYFADDSRLRTLLMTWSLGVEEQFYLIFPFVVLVATRFARRHLMFLLAVFTLLSFGLSLRWTSVAPAAAFYLLPGRAWELGAGVLLAGWEARGGRGRGSSGFSLGLPLQQGLAVAGLSVLLLGVTCLDEHAPFPGTLALIPVLGAAALIVSPDSFVNRTLLSCRPLTFVGLVSYSWYLWHWPLLSLLRTVVPRALPVPATAGVVALSFGVAVLSWRYVEQPFRHPRLSAPAVLVRYACVLALAVAVPVAVRSSGGFPQRLQQRLAELEAFVADLRRGKCLIPPGRTGSDDPDCRADATSTEVVAVLGDSHAWAMGPSLRRLAAKEGLGYEIFAKSSCAPLLGVSVRLARTAGFLEECAAFNDSAAQAIVSDPRVSTVVLAGYWSAPLDQRNDQGYAPMLRDAPSATSLALLRSGLKRMVDRLSAAGKHLVILQDVPDVEIDPLRIAIDEHMPIRRMVSSWFDGDVSGMRLGRMPTSRLDKHEDVRRTLVDIASGAPSATVRDPLPHFCDEANCTFNLGGEPLYFDHHHLSPVGATLALRGVTLMRN